MEESLTSAFERNLLPLDETGSVQLFFFFFFISVDHAQNLNVTIVMHNGQPSSTRSVNLMMSRNIKKSGLNK